MASKAFLALLVGAGIVPTLHAEVLAMRANPIRRVVNMLTAMQKKVTQEGEKEEELYNKFVCYCKTNKGQLADGIAAAETKIEESAAKGEEMRNEKEQLKADLKAHKADRADAQKSVAAANALREKEAAAYASSNTELNANSAAVKKAVAALEKGAAGGFLQTSAAEAVQKLVQSREMGDEDRDSVLAFLSGGQGYSPQSGQVTGILKQIGDEMAGSIKEETAAEEASIKDHAGLVQAKSKEIAAHTKAIEEKSIRVGEVAVAVANTKNDLKDTQESLVEDKAFFAELEKGCGTKEAEWNERSKVRADELVALAETIKLLQDDDALELFKKALPTPEASFLQLTSSMANMRSRALAEVRAARRVAAQRAPALDLIALALNGKTTGFEKVSAMIDKMVGELKVEQQDDDDKMSYCNTEFDTSDDKRKGLETAAADAQKAAATAKDSIDKLSQELKALAAGIADLDKSVADATEQRKQEHADYKDLIALNTQAKDLLGVAKNRLNKFYNPKLYIEPAKKELTQEEAVYQNSGLAAATTAAPLALEQGKPAPPPETFEGAYGKKSEESNSVIAMVDLLVNDLDKEMTVAETEEKEAQKDYEAMMADAKAKRAADSKSVSQKEQFHADLEGELQNHKDAKADAKKELGATLEYISGLHGECDWLLEHHDARKAARTGEVESLNNAKAVLAGADYSLVQVHERHHLRGRV